MLSAPPQYDWIGWTIGFIAVILAIFFYFKSRTRSRLAYQWSGRHLVGGNKSDLPDEVAISYKGANVPRLSSSEVVFWNAGNQTVRGSDIVEADPLRIVITTDAQILRAVVVSASRLVNSFSVKLVPERPNEASCTFDYLDPGDGVRLELLHTSEKRYPDFKGTLRGLPDGILDWGRTRPSPAHKSDFVGPATARLIYYMPHFIAVNGFIAVLAGLFAGFLGHHYPNWKFFSQASWRGRLVLGGAGLVYLLQGVALLWIRRRRFPKSLAED